MKKKSELRFGIGRRISALGVLSAAFSSLLVAVPLIVFQYAATEDSQRSHLDALAARVATAIADAEERNEVLAFAIGGSAELRDTLARQDRDGMQARVGPMFEDLKKTYGITQMQAHLAPATSFLRFHQPKNFGDDMTKLRPALVKVNTQKQPVRGIETGVFGIAVRGIVPVMHDGKHVGSFETGSFLDQRFLEKLAGKDEVLRLIVKDGGQYKVASASDGTKQSHADAATLDSVLAGGAAFAVIEVGDGRMALTHRPIRDWKGDPVAVLEAGHDATALIHANEKMWLTTILVILAAIVLVSGAAILFGRTLTRPIKAVSGALVQLADGNEGVSAIAYRRRDEIGDMIATFDVFREKLAEARRRAEEQAAEQDAKNRRHAAMEQLTREFNESVGGVLQTVTASARQLRDSAGSLSSIADDTSRQSTVVAAAAEQASTNVETVAAAAEELAATEGEIARLIARSTDIASAAAADASQVNDIVASLSQTTGKIGDIVDLINAIAAQTNLLSLNATIEAARAGEAGRGFAVVAKEVKGLAHQTAKATSEIASQINAVQSVTQQAVEAIGTIGRTITEINQSATAIAGAVEEQSSATQEIARNVQQAYEGTQDVTSSIARVKDGAVTSGTAAQQVLSTAEDLSLQAQDLANEVADFLSSIKTAGDRRHFERIPFNISIKLLVGDQTISATLTEASIGGARIEETLDKPVGTAMILVVPGWPRVRARIAGHLGNATRLQFALDEATRAGLQAALAGKAA